MIDLPLCLKAATLFLGQMHIPVEPLPQVFIVDKPGFYVAGPSVFLLESADCGVLLHELVHHAQALAAGPATTQEVWTKREHAARQIEIIFRSQDR
jgi:hypothetical protein